MSHSLEHLTVQYKHDVKLQNKNIKLAKDAEFHEVDQSDIGEQPK